MKAKQFKPIFDSPSPPRTTYGTRPGLPGYVSTVNASAHTRMFIQNMAQWKRRNKLSEEHHVFCISGGHPHFRKALLERGWGANKDNHSLMFDLKWAQKGKDIDQANLNHFQIVNHFQHTGALTTKIGLCHSLRYVHHYVASDPDAFYPKAFSMNEDEDREYFRTEF